MKQKASKGDVDTRWNMLPFWVLAAEMYNDEEARKGLECLISTVDSADRGKTNARYAPITVIATVGYLEWEAACGKALDLQEGTEDEPATPEQATAAGEWLETLECNGHGLRGGNNRRELYQLYSRAFADSLNQKFEEAPPDFDGADYEITRYGHGALFHMMQIAQALLSQRAGGPNLKAIEGVRWVWLYKNPAALGAQNRLTDRLSSDFRSNFQEAYMRRVDIILGDTDEPEQWIELKSYKALSETGPGREKLAVLGGKTIDAWGLATNRKGGENLHKQFSLDRAAAKVGHARLPLIQGRYPITPVDPGFQWRFQKFKKTLTNNIVETHPKFGTPSNLESIYGGLSRPLDKADTATGANRELYATNMGLQITPASHIKYGDLRTLLTQLAANGFSEAAEALAEEVFIDD
ncbi:MAG: hypothetical protein IPM37_00355 [Hahellaceae bacterium]|nr:hypothetical protein [Hahellaceae bacterium]